MNRVNKQELLNEFERLCKLFGVESAGFDRHLITAPIDRERHDGKTRWAMNYTQGLGWMIVCGKGGCGCKFSRAGGYIKGRWNFLIFIEGLQSAAYFLKESKS